MEFKAGDRVRVLRLNGKKVNFFTTLKCTTLPAYYQTTDSSDSNYDGYNLRNPWNYYFGIDRYDYYTLATDEEDTEEPEVQHVDDQFSFARSKNYEIQEYIQGVSGASVIKNKKERLDNMPTIKTKKRMNKKEYAQFLIDNAEIIEITASYRDKEKYEQNIKLEPLNNKTIPISKDILEVEIEQEITEDTVIPQIIGILRSKYSNSKVSMMHNDKSVNEIIKGNKRSGLDYETLTLHVINDDDTLTLIWTKEKGLVE
ncbi:hypothetical protein FPV13_08975 [Mammaliicoccus sciuri]|uniref:hypothetical protein n=1 Tax=Mammaliicoccus sciuri TaxID=1296 RepID=UPI001188F5F1|nr:hypothetical protein [Mammaliicoccus sciuri]QDR65007.1 hypothetical protein FPV13_08975 [Mammaliicoccus sciuri]